MHRYPAVQLPVGCSSPCTSQYLPAVQGVHAPEEVSPGEALEWRVEKGGREGGRGRGRGQKQKKKKKKEEGEKFRKFRSSGGRGPRRGPLPPLLLSASVPALSEARSDFAPASLSLSQRLRLSPSQPFSVLLCPSLSFSVLLFPSLSFSFLLSPSLSFSVLLFPSQAENLSPSQSFSVLLFPSLSFSFLLSPSHFFFWSRIQ